MHIIAQVLIVYVNVLTERAWLCVRWYFHGLREGILQQIQQSIPDQMTRA
jgi:hypothetical protein